jgi:hypothetical protein
VSGLLCHFLGAIFAGCTAAAPLPATPAQQAKDAVIAAAGTALMLGPWASHEDISDARFFALRSLTGKSPIAINLYVCGGLKILPGQTNGFILDSTIVWGCRPDSAIDMSAIDTGDQP